MPKQTLVIDSKAELSIKNGLLSIVREGKEEVFRSFEDIQTILIEYALLRSAMARALMDSGLMPTLGVFHRNYFNSFPLADDVMEPYRPYVDRRVYEYYMSGRTEVNKEFKLRMLELFYSDLRRDVLTKTTVSLVNVYCQESRVIYYPEL